MVSTELERQKVNQKITESFYGFEKVIRESNKPIEIKSALIWGALQMVYCSEEISWDELIDMYADFMAKETKVR
ncbi:glutaredoxin 2 [Clostridiales Family XIII bacterium PM5-7]